MNFIKKIFDSSEGEIEDNLVHLQFQKFSKGEFRNKAIIEGKTTGKGFSIKTSAEFSNELVRTVAEKLGSDSVNVTGAIVSTSDLAGKVDFKDKKQFQGVKRYLIDKEMSGNEIVSLLDEFPKNFFALSFSVGDTVLKIKAKAPKSAKPGKGEEDAKADFCSLKTSDRTIAESFIFEKQTFKEARVNHTFFIDEIVVSDDLKKTNDFARIREEAKRKGRILRKAVIDGEEVRVEKGFSA